MAETFKKYKEPKIIKAKRGWFIALYYEYPDNMGKYKPFETESRRKSVATGCLQ